MTDLPAVLLPLDRRPDRAALFLDFDGTLSPVVPEPAGARPLPGVSEVLSALVARFSLVAVVSGRPVAFLVDVLDHPAGVHLAGLYGMEVAEGGSEPRASAEVESWRPSVTEATRRATEEAPAGVEVEPKGLTVTLHWRARPEAEPWARRFADQELARSGLVAQPGRMALELRPPVSADKGAVVRALAPGHEAAACFGDDLGDLPAFQALGELAATGMAVARVAVVDPEAPPEVASAADVVVQGPVEALALLRRLARPG
ncbi:MAG TPA: trehalose-phosphatase [Acidimicrobiales bacterium]|nr:trehalose-phosphatase [Acidimicrobiales bacterium]